MIINYLQKNLKNLKKNLKKFGNIKKKYLLCTTI